ncbi:hypothetical protein BU17DRAFT_68803 [Hysterangium stoloniferum]|nr:hypothetical protein BU17DRAFT_68803 [Hysterangium stoloniferum]
MSISTLAGGHCLQLAGQYGQGHIYEIYPQPELPAADLYYHMKVWINYLETHVYGRALQDEDYLFPSINQARELIIQRLGLQLTVSGGVELNTGLCLLLLENDGHWPQSDGGVVGQKKDTLIRYLLDELHYYEESHGDALRPIKREADISFMGEHTDMRNATVGEIKALIGGLERHITNSITNSVTGHTPNLSYSQHCSAEYSGHNQAVHTATLVNTPLTQISTTEISEMLSPPVGIRVPIHTNAPKDT